MIRALGAVTALVALATAAAAQDNGTDVAGADAERPAAHGADRRRPGRRDGARRPVRVHALIPLHGLDLRYWQGDPRCNAPASRSRYVNRFATPRKLVATTRRSVERCPADSVAPEDAP